MIEHSLSEVNISPPTGSSPRCVRMNVVVVGDVDVAVVAVVVAAVIGRRWLKQSVLSGEHPWPNHDDVKGLSRLEWTTSMASPLL